MSIKSPFGPLEVPEIPLHRMLLMVYETHGDKVAVIDGITDKKYTFNDIVSTSKKIASGLVKQGVKKGDVVAIYSYNTPEWMMMFLGIVCTGATATTVNPAYTKYELTNHLKDSGASFLYTVNELVQTSVEAVEQLPDFKKIIALRSSHRDCLSYDSLIQDDASRWPELEQMEFDVKEDVVVLLYSSGTTGLPKGVMLTHYNILANGAQLGHPDLVDPEMAQAIAQGEKVNKCLIVLPFYHTFGLHLMMLVTMGGNQIVVLPKFEPRLFLSCIEKYKINMLPLVPPIVIFLAKSPLVKQYDLSSIERASSGAAPLSKETEEEFMANLSNVDIRQGYGMTETTCAASTHGYDRPVHHGSIGFLLPGMEAKIIDPATGQTLGRNQRGEICLRGPNIMKGYLNKPEQTREALDADRWLHTGDIAYYDEDECIYIVDRMKELIKVKGLQVAPAELEALLLKHPKVADVGVVGVPDERAGELPKAYIVKKSGIEVTQQELYDYAAEQTAPFKHLKGGIDFIAEIPRLPSGKILRRRLKELGTKSRM